ncbi:MAG: GNAT family N-acetyltransferase [Chloroflexota bacterium]
MLTIFEQDYGYGYQPQWHWDYDDLQGVYLDNPRHVLFVVTDDASSEIVGTAGIRSGGPKSPTLPGWLVERYQPPERAAQIVRVFVHPGYRRRGIARALVEACRRFVQGVGGYEMIALHSESAIDFWRTLPTVEVYDERSAETPSGAVHFELAMLDR